MFSQSVLIEREPPGVGDLVDIDVGEAVESYTPSYGPLQLGEPTRFLARVIHVRHRRSEFIVQRLVDKHLVGRLFVFDTVKSSWRHANALDRLVHDV